MDYGRCWRELIKVWINLVISFGEVIRIAPRIGLLEQIGTKEIQFTISALIHEIDSNRI